MKKFGKKYKNLIRLSMALVITGCLFLLGLNHSAIAFIACFQLMEFAMCKRRTMCYTVTALTPDQVQEFSRICNELKGVGEHVPAFLELAKSEGGFVAIKKLPELLKAEQKRVDELQGDIKKLRKQAAMFQGNTGVRWVGNVPFVTDDCARALTSIMVLETAKLGEAAMNNLGKGEDRHKGLIAKSCEFLGIEQKAAMTTTEIPVPTIYVPQIIELVFKFGIARQRATVFPLGAGVVKLPRLKAGEDDFGYLGVGTAGNSQAIGEKRVAAELVTFTANKLGGLIRIPTELDEDTFIPMGQFLARYISRQLAKIEDKTLFIGDGTATYANQTGVGPYCVANGAYLTQLAAGKTKVTDITLDDLRNLRGKVSPAVLANMAANGQTSAAYYFHPSMEPLLRGFNKYPNFVVFTNENGKPMFDGWPIVWIGTGAVNDGTAQGAAFAAFFGDLSFWYLGERGSVRVEVSKEYFFNTDELAMRALERIDVEALAIDAMSTLQLGAAA